MTAPRPPFSIKSVQAKTWKSRAFGFFCLCLFILFAGTPAGSFQADVIGVCFSPGGGCTDLIVKQIDRAGSQIRVMAYGFTSAPIGKALIRAKKRGVDVQVVMDRENAGERYSEVNFFQNRHIPVYADSHEEIMHDKVMIIDAATIITGSFNWTRAAEFYNAENVLIIRSRELAKEYLQNWRFHKRHSTLLAKPRY